MRKVFAVLIACAAAGPALAQDVSGVQQASQRFAAAMAGGDAATAAGLFTDDAVVLPPGREQLTGKPAIQRFLGAMTGSVQNLQYTSEDVHPLGEGVAREVGGFSFKSKGQSAQEVTGKYLIVWIKAGADWKIATDMWNRSGAPGGVKKGTGRAGGQGHAPVDGGEAQ